MFKWEQDLKIEEKACEYFGKGIFWRLDYWLLHWKLVSAIASESSVWNGKMEWKEKEKKKSNPLVIFWTTLLLKASISDKLFTPELFIFFFLLFFFSKTILPKLCESEVIQNAYKIYQVLFTMIYRLLF